MPPPCQASGTGGGRWQVAHLVRGRAGQLVGQPNARDVCTCRIMLRRQQVWQHPVAPVLVWVVHVHRLEHGGGLYHLADGPPAPRPAAPSVDACHQRIKPVTKGHPRWFRSLRNGCRGGWAHDAQSVYHQQRTGSPTLLQVSNQPARRGSQSMCPETTPILRSGRRRSRN